MENIVRVTDVTKKCLNLMGREFGILNIMLNDTDSIHIESKILTNGKVFSIVNIETKNSGISEIIDIDTIHKCMSFDTFAAAVKKIDTVLANVSSADLILNIENTINIDGVILLMKYDYVTYNSNFTVEQAFEKLTKTVNDNLISFEENLSDFYTEYERLKILGLNKNTFIVQGFKKPNLIHIGNGIIRYTSDVNSILKGDIYCKTETNDFYIFKYMVKSLQSFVNALKKIQKPIITNINRI
jgi:hypothetical protein